MKGRSRRFQAYLDSLPADERRTIIRAEARYLADREVKLEALERVHREQLMGASEHIRPKEVL